MPVLGNPYVVKIDQNKLHIGNLIVPAGQRTVIVFDDYAGIGQVDIRLPRMPHWHPYQNQDQQTVFLREALTVTMVAKTSAGVPVTVLKGGTTTEVFNLVLENVSAQNTGELEITLQFR